MAIYELWSGGYSVTGNQQPPWKFGEVEADSFEEAKAKWLETNDPWGCSIFPSYEEAVASYRKWFDPNFTEEFDTMTPNTQLPIQVKPPNGGLGCALIIIAACVGTALIMWAHQGFPGLPH